jgi:hypothetical protein
MTNDRAARYRRLAAAENDTDRARILRHIADEADRGLLHAPSGMPPPFDGPAQATPFRSPNSPFGLPMRGH